MRFSIGAKLASGFVVCAVLTLGVGAVALFALDNASDSVNSAISGHVSDMGAHSELVESLGRARRYEQEFFLFHEIGNLEKQRERHDSLNAAWDELEHDSLGVDHPPLEPGQADAGSRVGRLVPQTRAALDIVVGLMVDGKAYEEVQTEYVAYRTMVQRLEDAVEELSDAQERRLTARLARLAETQDMLRTIVIVFLSAAVVLAVTMWRIQTGLIVGPVGKLMGMTKRIASGDLSQRVEVGARDELGDLAQAFNGMTDGLLESREEAERKQREMAAANWNRRVVEERYNALLQLGGKVGEAVVMMQDTDRGQGIQTFVSDEWPGTTGYSRKELVDMSFFDLLHPDDRDEAVERHARLMSGSVVTGLFEMRLVNKGGAEVYIELTSGSSTYQGQRAVVSFIRDVSERKRAEAALQDTVAALTRSNTELQQFAYVASHDLQEPLRMVASYVQLLARRYKGKLDNDADDFIDFAVDGAKRMQRMINDLLTYSRVGTRVEGFRETSFEDVFRQAVDNVQLAIEESAATVTHDPLPEVSADESQMVQLLQNLIGNAVKFRGEAPPMVHVSARRDGEQWLFGVADNGVGIQPDDTERVFQIFQRGHNGGHPGTGIGLAVCRRVMERHDGNIWVESEVGKGSTFYFTMPATRGGS